MKVRGSRPRTPGPRRHGLQTWRGITHYMSTREILLCGLWQPICQLHNKVRRQFCNLAAPRGRWLLRWSTLCLCKERQRTGETDQSYIQDYMFFYTDLSSDSASSTQRPYYGRSWNLCASGAAPVKTLIKRSLALISFTTGHITMPTSRCHRQFLRFFC